MERSDSRDKNNTDAVSIIGAGITITGDVRSTTDLQVDGRIDGDIHCATVLLSEGGVVAGSIHAERVRVSGTVEGDIEAGDLAIEPTANVKGNISYIRLKVATGGVIEGALTRRAGEAPAAVIAPPAPEPASNLKLVETETAPRRVYVD